MLVLAGLAAGCASDQVPPAQIPPATAGTGTLPAASTGHLTPCVGLVRTGAVVGETGRLPELRLRCLRGATDVDLTKLGGRATVVNIWATWCRPCRNEMPLLQRAATQHRRAVQFLGISTRDRPTAAAAFTAEVGVTYPQLVDADGRLLARLGVPGLPVTLALDADGRVVGRKIGELTAEELDALLARLLAGQRRPAVAEPSAN